MSTNYRKLFNITIGHRYYSDGKGSGDFELHPTSETSKLLKSHGMRFISGDMGNLILYRVEYNSTTSTFDPFISTMEMAANLKLRFVLTLKNPYFFNISKLKPNKPLRSSIFHFKTSTATQSGTLATGDARLLFLNPTELDCRNAAFTYNYGLVGRPLIGELWVKDENGNTVQRYTSTRNELNKYDAHVEMSRFPPGKYGLQEINRGTPEGSEKQFYFDPELTPASTFGIIEISLSSLWKDIHDFNAIASNNTPVELAIDFKERKEQWIYKIVFKKTPMPANLVTEPVTIEETWVRVATNRYHNARASDEMFFIQDGSPSLFEGHNMLQFKSVVSATDSSDKTIPLYQETKKNLNLKIDGDTAFGDLPNPDYKNLKNEVIIYV